MAAAAGAPGTPDPVVGIAVSQDGYGSMMRASHTTEQLQPGGQSFAQAREQVLEVVRGDQAAVVHVVPRSMSMLQQVVQLQQQRQTLSDTAEAIGV